jgi:hypothetical protein
MMFPFILINLNPLSPRMICARSDQNWHSGSGEEIENVQVYREMDTFTDRWTHGRQQAIRKTH